MGSPEIGMVLHWRPPDEHTFHTNPSLIAAPLYTIGITPDQTTVYAEFYHGLRL